MLLLAGLQLSSRLQLAQKGLPADRGLLSSAAPDGERVERLALAPDDDVRDLGELGVADLAPKRLLALVHGGAEPVHAQFVGEDSASVAKRSEIARTRTCSGARTSGRSPPVCSR